MNRDYDLDLGVPEIMHTYELRKSGRGYHFRARDSRRKLVDELPDSDKGWAETPCANSRPSESSVKLEHVNAAFRINDRAFFRLLGWDNPNPSSTRRLRPRLTEIFEDPPHSSPVASPAAQEVHSHTSEGDSEEELRPLYKLGFGDPMVTESSSGGARHGSRLRRGLRGSPRSGEKSGSHSAGKSATSSEKRGSRPQLGMSSTDARPEDRPGPIASGSRSSDKRGLVPEVGSAQPGIVKEKGSAAVDPLAPSLPIDRSGTDPVVGSKTPSSEEKMARLAALRAEVDAQSGRIGQLPGSEKKRLSSASQVSTLPSKKSKVAVANPITLSPQPRPSLTDTLASKGKEAASALRLPPPLLAVRDSGARPFVPAPRATSRPVQTTDSGMKDRDVALGLIRSVVLEKDRALAGAISIPEIGSILQSIAYQVVADVARAHRACEEEHITREKVEANLRAAEEEHSRVVGRLKRECLELSQALDKERAERAQAVLEFERHSREVALDFEINVLQTVKDRLDPIEEKSREAALDAYDQGYRRGFQDGQEGVSAPGGERVTRPSSPSVPDHVGEDAGDDPVNLTTLPEHGGVPEQVTSFLGCDLTNIIDVDDFPSPGCRDNLAAQKPSATSVVGVKSESSEVIAGPESRCLRSDALPTTICVEETPAVLAHYPEGPSDALEDCAPSINRTSSSHVTRES
ncbi:hypothetical protein QJS10_CPB17g01858 [Acorus calamus]|uniref:Uncharacterized protein n=1 Tax=Acorus calamus TaxID=4465 RepID=A0AAV9CX35_ACOCL|nr:hypothetical protein QJS10_CPB17g01858 [Acorus calamus]